MISYVIWVRYALCKFLFLTADEKIMRISIFAEKLMFVAVDLPDKV